MAQRTSPPTGTHDVRQAAYRGTQGDVSADSGVPPRGRDRGVPSQPMPSPHTARPPRPAAITRTMAMRHTTLPLQAAKTSRTVR
ncbi:hypothetical protein NB696_000941 [Xanthomonas sacchari]|uniref:hypothetical protein n=1 Tax=Xanthomonas sacchari TaxID=56458 RepID=UPI002258180C|nr:hypothetical protein [Xanthomonas sacchari]MCW0397029.1 hypothetical protein [Xanthomonas sacchari]MCW0444069.1 hypothetical protein [Xanthomonas sacchari]